MYISKISLVNYRNFKNAYFHFNKGINTIIGENGSGKTNLFRAIRLLLDDDLLKFSYKLEESDFNRTLSQWRGHWIIISIQFSEISADESIQALFVHALGNGEDDHVEQATYNLFFRPKSDVRFRLSQLAENDVDGLNQIIESITIDDYESFFTGKSEADFNDEKVYKELVGDYDKVKFNLYPDASITGVKIPHQLSISKDVNFTFIKALRDVVSDFNNNRTNPLISLLKNKSSEINEDDYRPISDQVKLLNESIEKLPDVEEIRKNIQETIKETVGETYSPSSLSIKSSLPDEAEKLLQSLKLYIGEPDETYEGGIHELSLGGANLIFLTLKLLEFKYQKANESFANFLLIEEPEAHIHTHVQKTLFQNLDFGDTQIIYSTHSTFISEASNIQNVNILSKKKNYAEAYQPSTGLLPEKINKLQRYLDAVRSNLLFAKGVVLVEGDAEEILIPVLIKKVLGISLDEMGISLINIGSTGFENVAQIFHCDRIKRNCSIVTDLDQAICDTTILTTDGKEIIKYKEILHASQKAGGERKVLLDALVKGNLYLKACYATHTFEVDLLAGNEHEMKETVGEVYSDKPTQEQAKKDLDSDDVAIYGKRILTMARYKGKGWYALLLGRFVEYYTEIPNYIIDAIIFSKSTLSRKTISSIVEYRIKERKKRKDPPDFELLNTSLDLYLSGSINLDKLLVAIEAVLTDDQIIRFLQKL